MDEFLKHEHECCGVTDCYCGHFHRIEEVEYCKPMFLGGNLDHVHYYNGKTSKDDKHRHKICYFTGPSIPSASGEGHYHYFYSITSCDDSHIHYYRGMTDIYNNCE